jgi:hypothetical protein
LPVFLARVEIEFTALVETPSQRGLPRVGPKTKISNPRRRCFASSSKFFLDSFSGRLAMSLTQRIGNVNRPLQRFLPVSLAVAPCAWTRSHRRKKYMTMKWTLTTEIPRLPFCGLVSSLGTAGSLQCKVLFIKLKSTFVHSASRSFKRFAPISNPL